MEIVRAELVAVTGRKDQYPPEDLAEVAFAGRSNVGKSSLLNLLTGRKKLAHVSGSPGKTRTINFYEVTAKREEKEPLTFRIADLPGYGYAKVAKSVSEGWGAMMETYFEERDCLRKVVQLVDIRHEPSKQDVQMYGYLKHYGLDGLVVATKADKISRNQQQKQLAQIRKSLAMGKDGLVLPVSALKKTGWEELTEVLEEILT